MIEGLDPHQTGFVRGFGTHVNIAKLIAEMKKSKKKDKQCLIFIDFKSAYNTIIRSKSMKD